MTREEIAQILKQLRTRAGLTQLEAATALGRKQQTLASWETAQSQPDANTLFALCEIYGASVDEAFGFNAKKNGLSRVEQRIIDDYRSFNRDGQKKIVDYIDDLLTSSKYSTSSYELAGRNGKNKVELTPTQRKELIKVVDNAKEVNNSDLI